MRRMYHRRLAKGTSTKQGPDRVSQQETWTPLVSINAPGEPLAVEPGHRSLGLRIVVSVPRKRHN